MHVCEASGWTQQTFNMAPYAGKTVRIKFLVHQYPDTIAATDMYVDDVIIGAASFIPDNGDIYITRSTDNGATWGPPVRMDGSSTNGEQWMPSTAGAGTSFLVSWYDRKNTTNNDYERWGRLSSDGGATWAPAERISNGIIPQPAQPDPYVQPLYAGDYMRSFFDGTTFYDAWTDGRVAVMGVNQQDIFLQRLITGCGIAVIFGAQITSANFTGVRNCIDDARKFCGLAPFQWSPLGSIVYASELIDMRNAVTEAYTKGLSKCVKTPPLWNQPDPKGKLIKAVDLVELKNAADALR